MAIKHQVYEGWHASALSFIVPFEIHYPVRTPDLAPGAKQFAEVALRTGHKADILSPSPYQLSLEVVRHIDGEWHSSRYASVYRILDTEDGPHAATRDAVKFWLAKTSPPEGYDYSYISRHGAPAALYDSGIERAEVWAIDGLVHRADGPAVTTTRGETYYMLRGQLMTEHAWQSWMALPEDVRMVAEGFMLDQYSSYTFRECIEVGILVCSK